MPIYNKLVRDQIPEIIKSSGKKFSMRILNNEECITELKNKLNEELLEYLNANNDNESVEEIADILEILYTLSTYHGSSIEIVEKIRMDKVNKRGSFKNKVFLIDVED